MSSKQPSHEKEPLLPSATRPGPTPGTRRRAFAALSVCSIFLIITFASAVFGFGIANLFQSYPDYGEKFYSSVTTPRGLCAGKGRNISHAGFIGLNGDTDNDPKRSFFWFFEAQEDSDNAPVILAFGGGPGTSGMMNPLRAQSHCIISESGDHGLVPNPNAWTEHFNLIALDHPIGVGFSYGRAVNNSRSAAIDVYDFLQKFFILFPHLAKNQFVVTAGSYGGTYVPHVATVIHEQNLAVASGKGQPGAIHINLESLIVSNPISDGLSHYRWMLHQRCYNTHLYNSTECAEKFEILPLCLEKVEYAFEVPSIAHRIEALEVCERLEDAGRHGVMREDVRKKCNGTVEDCFPWMLWITDFMNDQSTKRELGIPDGDGHKFSPLSDEVFQNFGSTGDQLQQAHLLYEPLLKDGIRLLHVLGMQDCNCAWPGVLSFLKLLRTPFQDEFIHTPDVPWPEATSDEATIRVIGSGSGTMTYIQVFEAGHFVVQDQPALMKKIIKHWIDNKGF